MIPFSESKEWNQKIEPSATVVLERKPINGLGDSQSDGGVIQAP
jgi:hypothetical protein